MDFSDGTVFFLFNPFTEDTLEEVSKALRKIAEEKRIRIVTWGPSVHYFSDQRWLKDTYIAGRQFSIFESLDLILDDLGLHDQDMQIEIFPHIPRAMGLGGSAALAVAIIRALSKYYKLNLSDEKVAGLSFRSETIVHGPASGIDNTLATYGRFIKFKKALLL